MQEVKKRRTAAKMVIKTQKRVVTEHVGGSWRETVGGRKLKVEKKV